MTKIIEARDIPIENQTGPVRKIIQVWPDNWPKWFYENSDGLGGITCSGIPLQDKPCEGCDGKKCVKLYIDSTL